MTRASLVFTLGRGRHCKQGLPHLVPYGSPHHTRGKNEAVSFRGGEGSGGEPADGPSRYTRMQHHQSSGHKVNLLVHPMHRDVLGLQRESSACESLPSSELV